MGAHIHLTNVRLTQDPEEVETSAGKVVRFGIAWNDKYTDAQGQLHDEVNYLNCSCWGPKANVIMSYLKKGHLTTVHGRLKYREWIDRQTGVERHEHSCTVFDVELMPKKVNEKTAQTQTQQPAQTRQTGPHQQNRQPANASQKVTNAFAGSEFPPEGASDNEDEMPF